MKESLVFNCSGYEMLRLCSNGDIFVKAQIITNDRELVEGFKAWLAAANKQLGSGSIVREEVLVWS
jgi:hypothetical protein